MAESDDFNDPEFKMKLAAVRQALDNFVKIHEDPADPGHEEKHEILRNLKAQGTTFFQKGYYVKAIFTYRKIFDHFNFEEPYLKESKDIMLAGALNISLCWMKLKEWKRAKTMCTKILELEMYRDTVKAWYRRGNYFSKIL